MGSFGKVKSSAKVLAFISEIAYIFFVKTDVNRLLTTLAYNDLRRFYYFGVRVENRPSPFLYSRLKPGAESFWFCAHGRTTPKALPLKPALPASPVVAFWRRESETELVKNFITLARQDS
jgi:hypothetical protein